MIDIILTTYNRIEFLKRTLDSISANTQRMPYRLFIIDDCSDDGTQEYLSGLRDGNIKSITLSKQRNGIRYGFNKLWAEVELHNSFYGKFKYLCYHQDDVEILNPRWAEILIGIYEKLGDSCNIGFFSGCDSAEHPVQKEIKLDGYKLLFKFSQAFQNTIAPKEFWKKIGIPIPKFNPNGQKVGFPNNGMGSNTDVWFMGCCSGSRFCKGAASPNCSFTQRKFVMVIPMMKHLGKSENSTWRSL